MPDEDGMAADLGPGIEYLGVRVEAGAIHQMRGDASMSRVGRAEILGLELRHGPVFTFEHGLGALIYLGAGMIGLAAAIATLKDMDGPSARWMYGTVLFPVGAWCLLQCIRRRTYLEVRTRAVTHRLVFRGHPSRDSLEAFRAQVKSAFGYEIVVRGDAIVPKD